MNDFKQLLSAYRITKAELDRHCATSPDAGDITEYERRTDRLSDLHTEALDRLLLTPAQSAGDFLRKLNIIVQEEIHDGWHLAAPIMALLRADGERLLSGVNV